MTPNNELSTFALRSGKPRPRRSRKKFKNEEVDLQETPAYILDSMSGKDRLLAIIAAEKAEASETALKASSQLASEAATAAVVAYKEDKVSCASTETTTSEQHGSLLRRGVATLRRSFRKAIPKKTGSFRMNKKNYPAAADFSHDSGLGEESDASRDPCLSSPVTTPTPILRTTRSFSNDSQQPVNGKYVFPNFSIENFKCCL